MTRDWIVQNGNLITENVWKKEIAQLQRETGELFTDREQAKKALQEQLARAIKERAKEPFGIFFSGGVDSSFIALVCKKLNKNLTCYSVGLEGSKDLEYAEKVAQTLDLPWRSKCYSLEEVEQIIQQTVKIVPRRDVVTIGVASVVIAALELAKQDRIMAFFSGLGSEEIFAGYERHARTKSINTECWNGLKNMWQRDLVRDFAVGKHYGITLHTPFLDKDVIKAAMRAPGNWKLQGEQKKIILREIAENMGLPKAFAWRKKQAAQYGSKVDKAIAKLAKQHGFQYKKEYLESL